MNVRVRPYAVQDGSSLLEAATESVKEVYGWMPWCHAGYTRAEANEWAAMQAERFKSRSEFQFVFESEAGRFLGAGGLNRFDTEHKFANLGYWVRSSASGMGVAPRAVKLIVAWAFDHTEFQRLEIVVAAGNTRSERVAEKVGAIREGVLRSRLLIHGKRHDATVFSVIRGDVYRTG